MTRMEHTLSNEASGIDAALSALDVGEKKQVKMTLGSSRLVRGMKRL